MTKEALKLALEALETPWNAPYVDGCDLALGKKVKAITAIKEALAQPEQEQLMSDQINYGMSVTQGGKRIDPMSIYKEPEQEPVAWVDPATLHHLKIGLEGVHLVYETEMVNSLPLYDKPQFANSKNYLERLIRIMGTFDLATGHANNFDELLDSLESELRDVLGHYRQQRTWVGLTDEEISDLWCKVSNTDFVTADTHVFARAIEAAHGIKEKNNG